MGDSADGATIINSFYDLALSKLYPLDEVYRGRSIFPVREDDSIFLSLAAFREHLLKGTLVGAFKNAKDPSKLFVGTVVQNCFGLVDDDGTIHTDGNPCRTGAQVTGKNAKGRDMTKVSDAPPDKNGVQELCEDPEWKKYCDSGNVRALYVHETESLGPAMARYYASKLWGGENYFIQCDSHLEFAEHWDEKYISEVKATKNYPKSVLSSYPPGFSENGHSISDVKVQESPGARMCTCEFSLTDVPFDPFMPWCFMGEEIALSIRAWTAGWNIYGPRKNLIAHQYRPGRMGLPKYWGTVNRLYKRPSMSNALQDKVIGRAKNLVGYPDSSYEELVKSGYDIVISKIGFYGVGSERTLREYLEFTNIDPVKQKCGQMKWCDKKKLD